MVSRSCCWHSSSSLRLDTSSLTRRTHWTSSRCAMTTCAPRLEAQISHARWNSLPMSTWRIQRSTTDWTTFIRIIDPSNNSRSSSCAARTTAQWASATLFKRIKTCLKISKHGLLPLTLRNYKRPSRLIRKRGLVASSQSSFSATSTRLWRALIAALV